MLGIWEGFITKFILYTNSRVFRLKLCKQKLFLGLPERLGLSENAEIKNCCTLFAFEIFDK